MLLRITFAVWFILPGFGQQLSYSVSTVAGADLVLDNVPAIRSTVAGPSGIAADKEGNVYIADSGNNRVRKISRSSPRMITTVAGCGYPGFSGEGLPATQGMLSDPSAVAVDALGNLYVVDVGNMRIRKVLPDGTMVTLAGNGDWDIGPDGILARQSPLNLSFIMAGVAVDAAGSVYFSEATRIRKITPDGIVFTVPGTEGVVDAPGHLAFDPGGSLYVADSGHNRVLKITPDGKITVHAGTGTAGFAGDGGPATQAQLNAPSGVAFDAAGNLYIADMTNYTIRKVTPDGIIHSALRDSYRGLGIWMYAVAPVGEDLYIAGSHGVSLASSSGEMFTYIDNYSFLLESMRADLESVRTVQALAVDGSGTVYFSDDPSRLRIVTSAGMTSSIPIESSGLRGIIALAFDASGNLYISDNTKVCKMTPDKKFSLIAGTSQMGFSGDGGPAINAQLGLPIGLAVDASGNLFIAESRNLRIRRITPDGVISTVAGNGSRGTTGDGGPAVSASLSSATAVAVDPAGNIYIPGDDHIRKVDKNGIIRTVLGGLGRGVTRDGVAATRGTFADITSVAVDSAGTLLFTEGNSVRIVTSSGTVRTLAGIGTAGFRGDGGPATRAALARPTHLATDRSGNIFVVDWYNGRIRKLTPNPPAKLVIESGNNQSAPAGACSATPLRVKVTGSTGIEVPSVDVAFAITAGSATLTRTSTQTDARGIAGTEFAFGSAAGKVTVQASVRGLVPVEFALVSSVPDRPPSPCISKDGVAGAALGAELVQKIVPGSLVSVFGQNLADAGTSRQVRAEDITGGRIPTRLSGVCVFVGGVPAPLLFVSPGQVNLQSPAVDSQGNVSIEVVRNCSEPSQIRSGTEMVEAATAAPEFFYYAHAEVGPSPVVAVNATTGKYVGEPGLVSGLEFEPAKQGDVLVLYATGLGPMAPAQPPGLLVSEPASVVALPVVTIQNMELPAEDVLYAGAVPGFVGLYQVNLRLSQIVVGDPTIRVRIGTAESPSSGYLKTTK